MFHSKISFTSIKVCQNTTYLNIHLPAALVMPIEIDHTDRYYITAETKPRRSL